jgi:hypothetical protein
MLAWATAVDTPRPMLAVTTVTVTERDTVLSRSATGR